MKKLQKVIIIVFVIFLIAVVTGLYLFREAEIGKAMLTREAITMMKPRALVAVQDTAPSFAVIAAQSAANQIQMTLGTGTVDLKLFHEIDPTDLKSWQLIVLVNGKSPSDLVALISVDPNASAKIITAATAARNAIGVTSVKSVMTHPELTLKTLEEAYP